jgi:hypothetical protein
MAEYVIYRCGQCSQAYRGMVEVTEQPVRHEDSTGICGECLENLCGLNAIEEGTECHEIGPTQP